MLWYQGLDGAPLVVKKCVESWIRENPGWDVVVLDAESLKRYVTPDLPPDKLARLDLTKQSNLVRLQLLADFGGVWVDATVLCLRPLDEWIDECTASGFFAFAFPDGHSRVLSTWFLVSERHCPIVVKWRQRYASFFLENDLDANTGRARDLAKRALTRVLDRSRRTTRYWLSPVVTRLLRIYPYFVFDGKWQATLLKLNPFTHLAITYQEILFFNGPVGHLKSLLLLGVASVALFFVGYFLFDRLRDSFAEEV